MNSGTPGAQNFNDGGGSSNDDHDPRYEWYWGGHGTTADTKSYRTKGNHWMSELHLTADPETPVDTLKMTPNSLTTLGRFDMSIFTDSIWVIDGSLSIGSKTASGSADLFLGFPNRFNRIFHSAVSVWSVDCDGDSYINTKGTFYVMPKTDASFLWQGGFPTMRWKYIIFNASLSIQMRCNGVFLDSDGTGGSILELGGPAFASYNFSVIYFNGVAGVTIAGWTTNGGFTGPTIIPKLMTALVPTDTLLVMP